MKRKALLHAIFIIPVFFLTTLVVAQNVAINATNSPPDSLAMLDVQSKSKGFLPPRLTSAQRNTLAASLTSAQTGLQVADNPTGKIFSWAGNKWTVSGYSTSSPFIIEPQTNALAINAGTQAGDLITWDGNNWITTQPAPDPINITYNNRQPYLALNYCIAFEGIFPSRTTDEPFMAEIQLFAFNFPPHGFKYCNGALYSIQQFTGVFALLGTTYGGNGITTFGVPDLRGRVPIHAGQGAGLSNRMMGDTGGTETNSVIH